MSKKTATKAEKNVELYNNANNINRDIWQESAIAGYRYYIDEQLTRKEKDQLVRAGMPSFTVNRITPAVKIMLYFITGNNPKWLVTGEGAEDYAIANIHSKMADRFWYISNGSSQFNLQVTNVLTKGLGYAHIYRDKNADRGLGEVKWINVDPEYVFVDSSSKDILFRDAGYIQIVHNFSKAKLIQMYPEFESKIDKMSAGTTVLHYGVFNNDYYETSSINPKTNLDEQLIPHYETYMKVSKRFWNIIMKIPPSEEEQKLIIAEAEKESQRLEAEYSIKVKEKEAELVLLVNSPDEGKRIIEERAIYELKIYAEDLRIQIDNEKKQIIDEISNSFSKTRTDVINHKEYLAIRNSSSFKELVVSASDFFENRIEIIISIGDDMLVYNEVTDETEYPIIPLHFIYLGNPWPLSAVKPAIGKQDEVNKAHQLMIHNANLSSNSRWMGKQGTVTDTDEWKMENSRPNGFLQWNTGTEPPQQVLPQQLNNAFYQIQESGKSDISFILGVDESMMGVVGAQHDTFKGIMANDQFGTRIIKHWMNTNLNPFFEHFGKVATEMMQNTYTIHKVFRVVSPSGERSEESLSINIPQFDAYGEVVGRYNDYGSSKFDIRIVPSSTLPSSKDEKELKAVTYYEKGIFDDIQTLKYIDTDDKDALVQRKALYSQMKAQIENMEAAIKSKDGEIDTLSRQVMQSELQRNEEQLSKDSYDRNNDLKYAQKLAKGKIQNELDQLKDKITLLEKSINLESKKNLSNKEK